MQIRDIEVIFFILVLGKPPRKIVPGKIAPDPSLNRDPNPNSGGNLLGAIFRGAIFRSPFILPLVFLSNILKFCYK